MRPRSGTAAFRDEKLAFRPRARLLALLGDQLIRDPGIALFELVKNGYDADASRVNVTIHDPTNERDGRVIVLDNGSGMDWNIVTKIWLEPGTDYRERQKREGTRSPTFQRLPLGEKGVGRFAAHKLGDHVELVTRSRDGPEVVVEVDWSRFNDHDYLADTPIIVREREPEVFIGKATGTRITVSRLRQTWTRGMVRELHRSITSICSPFDRPDDFSVALNVAPENSWLDGLLDMRQIMQLAPYRARCLVRTTSVEYEYAFEPPPGMRRLSGRKVDRKAISLNQIVDLFKIGTREEIGDFTIDLRIFDFDPQVLAFLASDRKGLRQFMHRNGGVRVYRDGVRVFDYGEPGNDWLQLGTRRVNVPTLRVSNNQILGAVNLRGAKSRGLIEKTNREGFVENSAYSIFRDLVIFSLQQIEQERNIDKDRLRKTYTSGEFREPVIDDIADLREEIKQRHLEEVLGPIVDRIQKQFVDVRDRLLTAAGPGLTMSVVIHEVEKGIRELVLALQRNATRDELRRLGNHLSELVEGLTYLIRKSGRRTEKASILIQQAIFNTNFRTTAHGVRIFNGLESGGEDIEIKCTRRLIIATLMNLIDNSIYWLDVKGGNDKRILIGTTNDLEGGWAIYVADNGPGFADPPEYLVQPFMTRRPDGMGLGLHVANEIMKAHGGQLLFPARSDLALPRNYTGAIVALQFRGEE